MRRTLPACLTLLGAVVAVLAAAPAQADNRACSPAPGGHVKVFSGQTDYLPDVDGFNLVQLQEVSGQACVRGTIRGLSNTVLVSDVSTPARVTFADARRDGSEGLVRLDLTMVRQPSRERVSCSIVPDRPIDESGIYEFTIACDALPTTKIDGTVIISGKHIPVKGS